MPRSVFEIFLSSTSQDLQDCRAKVREAIERMRQVGVRMETFGARPTQPLPTCRDIVKACDALIVIVGHRYGWIPSAKEGGNGQKSITWWEVSWALAARKPVFAFLLDSEAQWSGSREQDRLVEAEKAEQFVEIGRAVRQLQAFRAFLERKTTRETFVSGDDLATKVATSLHPWLIEQAVAAVRAEARAATPGGAVHYPHPKPTGGPGRPPASTEVYCWEQIHLLSAQMEVDLGKDARIALLAGRANPEHPALRSVALTQVAVARGQPGPDDYTTALAALLAGRDETSGYRGISPGSSLLVLGVHDESWGIQDSDIVAALEAALTDGATVVCLPAGGFGGSEQLAKVYARLAEAGLLMFCPAGNEASAEPTYPGAYPDCLTVAALDRSHRLAEFSGYGPWVDTAAPGVDLSVAVGEDGYRSWSGTSFSCAIAAGVGALMLRANPKLRSADVKRILRSSGVPLAASGPTVGLLTLDAYRCVQAAKVEAPAQTPALGNVPRTSSREKPIRSKSRTADPPKK